ncbi:hypothetical protein J437_LFUL002752 [Ladona fulva]|uniref:Uncharacterized protein n=1 Tax=Ladona fulva TaxID=123851 RepID=A0A8K0NS56_LADFU|nr:hypothetical protein J437_LFUL002752 [Ladona fulva]
MNSVPKVVLSSLGKVSVDGRPPVNVGSPLPSPSAPVTTASGSNQFVPMKTERSPPPVQPVHNYKSPSPNSQHLPAHQPIVTQVSPVHPHAPSLQHAQGRPSFPQTVTSFANSPKANSPQLTTSHSSSNVHQVAPVSMPNVHRQIPTTHCTTYQVIPSQPVLVNSNCPTNIPRMPQNYNHVYSQQVQQRLMYSQQQQQLQAQQLSRQHSVNLVTAAGTVYPIRGQTILTQQQVSSSTHPGHGGEIGDLNLKGLLTQAAPNVTVQHMHPRVLPQNSTLTTMAPNVQVPKPSFTMHHRFRQIVPQGTTQDNSAQPYPQPLLYQRPPPLIPVTSIARPCTLSPSYRTVAPNVVQHSWHIPQHGKSSQEPNVVASYINKRNAEVTDGLPFKITIRAPNNSQVSTPQHGNCSQDHSFTGSSVSMKNSDVSDFPPFKITLKAPINLQVSGPSSTGDSTKAYQVTSSAPENALRKNLAKGDDGKSLDEFCQDSVKDLMATIGCLDDSSNPARSRSANRNGSSIVENSLGVEVGSASTSDAVGSGVVSPSMEQQVHVDSSTGSPLVEHVVHSKKRRKIHKENHMKNNSNADGQSMDGKSPMRDDPNEDWCAVCMDGGELVCCDKCPKVYHIYCHIPPLKAFPGPSEAWQCLLCTSIDDILSTPLGPRQSTSSRGLCQRDLQLARRILLELYCHYEPSLAFRELPGAECEGYFEVIRRPMSLDIIRSKLDPDHVKHYKVLGEFVDDVRQVFSNAYTFNPEESQVFSDARALEEFFTDLLKKWLPVYLDEDEFDQADPSYDEEEDDDDEALFGSPPRRRHRSK